MKLTSVEENYLFTIHDLSDGSNVSTNQLANKMGVAAASVTDMVQKLAEKDYVRYEKYRGVSLLPSGLRIAKQLTNTKTLWRTFLIDHLQISEQESERLLEELQHVRTSELKTKLSAYLSAPVDHDLFSSLTVEEILEQPEKQIRTNELTLNTATFEEVYFLKGLTSITTELLELLMILDLPIGSKIVLKKQFDLDGSFQVIINEQSIILSKEVSAQLIVTTI